MAAPRYAVIWSSDAEDDLVEIWQYLVSEASPRVAISELRDIARACDRLERSTDDLATSFSPGMRSILAQPYVVFYRVAGRTVEIVRVLHGRRDIEAQFSDDE
jgi:toxin ParE1/3/4